MRSAFFSIALVLALSLSGLSGQDQKPSPSDPTRITLEVNRVNLLFTVSDKKGRFVTDLAKEDFDIKENKNSQHILEDRKSVV